jgi:hypothetical protein
MRAFRADRWAALGMAAALAAILVGPSIAQVGDGQAKSARGGLLAKAEGHEFEVFFYPTGVRVFGRAGAGAPADTSKLGATATFYHPNSPKPWFTRPLVATSESLDLAIGLSNAPPSGAKVAFVVTGLSGPEGSAGTFTVPLEFVPQTPLQPTVAQPTAPNVVAPSPRYVYGPGYYGFGYYQYPGPESAPVQRSAPTVYGYSTPSGHSRGGGSSGVTHDWSTGRDYPAGGLISKPWLRPRD